MDGQCLCVLPVVSTIRTTLWKMQAGMPRILVALSGGVDSAVTALTLKQQGWEPIGIHLRLFDSDPETIAEGVCCGDQAAADARQVAAHLDMPFYVRDLRDDFARDVAQFTIDSYAAAKTPNPCLNCNHKVRIPALLRLADSLDIEKVATGHYVRKVRVDGRWYLAEGGDPRRDQSYALYRLTHDDLERLEFPLGEMDKTSVRDLARSNDLHVAQKASSVDLCFAKTAGGVGNLVSGARPETGRPGQMIDEGGRVVGEHPGIAYVTIGQRRGLQWNITTPERKYISSIDPESGAVRVATKERILTASAVLENPIWHGPIPEAIEARIRYQGPRFPVRRDGDRVGFIDPGPPLARGQAVVLYDGNRLLGGGIADEVTPAG
jgi:tRNA-uridine 2-sulfurtransferase